jgi:MFS family permease
VPMDAKDSSAAAGLARWLRSFARRPVQYYRHVPAPIRILSIGVLINRIGGFVTVFLALILAIRNIPATGIGIALLMAAASAIAGSWLGGAMVTRWGSRRTIFLSMAGSALFTAALIPDGPYLLTVAIVCLISLFNRAYVPAASTKVGRLSPPGERVQMFAFFQLCFNVGAAAGPAIAGFLLTRSLTALLVIDAGTSACFALAGLRLPADTELPPAEPRTRSPAAARPRWIRHDRRYLAFCVGVALVAVVYRQSSGPLPLIFRAHHYNLELLGYLFSANAIAVILFQLPASFLTRRLPVRVPLALGALLIGGAYTVLLAGVSLPLLIINVALWSAGEILYYPVTPAVAMMMSADRTHGAYQGALDVARSTGQAIGPSIGVFAYSVRPWLPWWGCGVLGIAAASLFLAFLRAPQPRRQEPDRTGGAREAQHVTPL